MGFIVKTAVLTTSSGTTVCERCSIAADPFTRARGLLGRSSLPSGEGILLRPASSVHTGFMRFAIDVVFLDRELTVLRVVERLAPWRTAARRRAHAVLELAAGECGRRGLREGDRLEIS
jgi:uncharacterized membrane protein (UPF0127 family)